MALSLRFLLAVFFCVCAVRADDWKPVKFKDCKSHWPVSALALSGCQVVTEGDRQYCLMEKNTNPRVQITFTPGAKFAGQTLNNLETLVRARVNDAFFDYNLIDNDPCKSGNLKCPLAATETHRYEQTISIRESYPTNSLLQVNFRIRGRDSPSDDGNDVCAVFMVKIKE